MLFHSLGYVVFGGVVFFLYYLSAPRLRLPVLLGASLLFYALLKAWHLVAVLGATTVFTYYAAFAVESRTGRSRKTVLALAVAFPVVVLIFFHCLTAMREILNGLLGIVAPAWTIPAFTPIVSIGVSFFTFQSISYFVDVYRGERAERHFGWFALYMAFFPKIIQGPIERAAPLIRQLRNTAGPDAANIQCGVYLFLIGLFKKVVIADRMGIYADTVFNDAYAFQGISLLLGVYAYTFQIYFDFSGYTDMALGTARLFNVDLTQNFRRPYLATSVSEFWRRWHVSLSTWLRDYLYIPLGGSRMGLLRRCENLVLVFFVCGLWHGAGLTFATWGLLHGLYLVAGVVSAPFRSKVVRKLRIEHSPMLRIWRCFFVFNLVALGWIFFRSGSMREALYIVQHLFSGMGGFVSGLAMSVAEPSRLGGFLKEALRPVLASRIEQPAVELGIVIFSMLAWCAIDSMMRRRGGPEIVLAAAPGWARWAAYYVLIGYTLFLGAFNAGTQFIYMQF